MEQLAAILLVAALASLFTSVETRMAGIAVKPFDLMAICALPILCASAWTRSSTPATPGIVLFLAFFAVHTLSAFRMSTINGVRELIQTAELCLLYLAVLLYRNDIDWQKTGKLFILLVLPTLVYTVAWHVSHGYVVGWKQLGNTKSIFLFLPPVVCAFLVFRRSRLSGSDYLILGLLAALVVASGERKALFNLVLVILLLVATGYIDPVRLIVGAGAGVVALAAVIAANSYANQQFQSIIALTEHSDVSVAQLVMGHIPSSMSNAQRVFALDVTKHLVHQNPWFGLGTNAYEIFIKGHYGDAPKYLLTTIHNEFQRILVENGFVGISVYATIWVRSALYPFRQLWSCPRPYFTSYIMFMSTFLHYCLFEGSGNESFIVLVFVAVLPELYAVARVPSELPLTYRSPFAPDRFASRRFDPEPRSVRGAAAARMP